MAGSSGHYDLVMNSGFISYGFFFIFLTHAHRIKLKKKEKKKEQRELRTERKNIQ